MQSLQLRSVYCIPSAATAQLRCTRASQDQSSKHSSGVPEYVKAQARQRVGSLDHREYPLATGWPQMIPHLATNRWPMTITHRSSCDGGLMWPTNQSEYGIHSPVGREREEQCRHEAACRALLPNGSRDRLLSGERLGRGGAPTLH